MQSAMGRIPAWLAQLVAHQEFAGSIHGSVTLFHQLSAIGEGMNTEYWLRVIPCKYQKIVATHSHRFYSNHDFWVEGQKRNIETSLCFSKFSLVSMETGHQIYKTCIF